MPPKGHQRSAVPARIAGWTSEHPEAEQHWDPGPRRDGNRTAGPQLGQPAAGTAGRANGCPVAHRVPADAAVPAALHRTRRHHARRLSGYRRVLDRRRRCCWSPRWACTDCCSAGTASTTLVSASHSYAIAGLLLLGVALAGVSDHHLRPGGRDGPPPGSPAGARWLALARFWFLLPLRERGNKDSPHRFVSP